jgi:hypothetical protein
MIKATATDVAKRFSRYRQAAQHEPVAVTHHGRITEVLISKRDHDEYVRLKGLATRALWTAELPPETLEVLAASRMDPRHDHLNDLMDD